jgi:hypothetical protein
LLSVQWINSWWWTDELSETCKVSWQNKFEKLVYLQSSRFIYKEIYYDARSHGRIVTMHGHMNVLLRCTVTWTYCYDARSRERIVTMHCHMHVKFTRNFFVVTNMQLRESTFLKKTSSVFRFNLSNVTRHRADMQFIYFGTVYMFNSIRD